MSRTVKDVLNEYRDSANYKLSLKVDWAELESRINYYIQTEVERRVRLDALEEICTSECPACKDKAPRFIAEEQGEWAHERGEGIPYFLCEAPRIICDKIFELQSISVKA